LTTYLHSQEYLKSANGAIEGFSVSFPDNWVGMTNLTYAIFMEDQMVEFVVALHFLDLPDALWYKVVDAVRIGQPSSSPSRPKMREMRRCNQPIDLDQLRK
jgi:hypothetical protein